MSEPTEAEWLEGNDPMTERERMETAMTTDNRTNEPTEAMILAALNAYSSKGLEIDGYDPVDEYPSLDMWGERFASQMRAALVAAQGATTEELAKIKPLFENLSREYPNECNKRVKAEAERDAALEAIERIRQAVSGHPECDRYEEGDVISCGWKSAYASVLAALDGAHVIDESLPNHCQSCGAWGTTKVHLRGCSLDGAPEPEAERDAALARIAELEKSYRIVERLYKIERQERIEAEARIAEAAKHPAAANCMFSWRSA